MSQCSESANLRTRVIFIRQIHSEIKTGFATVSADPLELAVIANFELLLIRYDLYPQSRWIRNVEIGQ
jgi:hypothetical protein